MGGVLIVVAVVLAVGLIAYLNYQRAKRRRLGLAAVATQFEMQYAEADPFGLLGYGFGLFRMGDGRGCENVLWGSWQGLPIKESDYWYYDESTDDKGNRTKSYHYFSVVVADLDVTVPHVSVTKESVFTRLADHVGLRDIEFESEAFNRAFNVKSEDREFAFKLVDARMIEWMITTEGRFGFECLGPNVLVYARRMRPTELVPLFGTAKAFSDHIPQLVRTQYGTGGPVSSTDTPSPPT